jgi:hypothetical protein
MAKCATKPKDKQNKQLHFFEEEIRDEFFAFEGTQTTKPATSW